MNLIEWATETRKIADGFEGESLVRDYLVRNKISHMQVDIIFIDDNGKYNVMEIKHQEYFKSPPFDGHGLPKWQIEARMKFYEATGVIPWLFVVEKGTYMLYYETLPHLLNGEQHQTHGTKPRTIFPLDSFRKRNLSQ